MLREKSRPRVYPAGIMLFILFLAAAGTGVFGEETSVKSYTIEELAKQSQSENPDIKKASTILQQAEADRAGEPAIKNSSLTVTGGYNASLTSPSGAPETAPAAAGAEADGFMTQASVSLPVLSQVAFGGTVGYRQGFGITGNLSLELTPFALSPQTYSQEAAYGKALVEHSFLVKQTYFNAEQAVLSLQLAGMRKDYATENLAIEQEKYNVLEQEVDLGEAVLVDLLDQTAVLASAQEKTFSAESAWMTSWKDVQLLFYPKKDEFEFGQVSIENLLGYIDRRTAELEKVKNLQPASRDLKNLQLELAAMNSQLSATPAWRPDVNLTASLSFPDTSLALSASLSFSPKDVVLKERNNLKENIELKNVDLSIEQFKLGLQVKLQTQGISIAERALASAKKEQEKAALTAKESSLLFDQGELTSLELARAGLNEKLAVLNTYAAAVNLYKAQADFIMLFLDSDFS